MNDYLTFKLIYFKHNKCKHLHIGVKIEIQTFKVSTGKVFFIWFYFQKV